MYLINGYVLLCLSITFLYFIGLLTFITDHEENKCEMTYMFQYPQFVRVLTHYDDRFDKYGLYAYNEGHFTQKTRNMFFDGIPVLFIPGNGGSYKQVRSLASVALRKAVDSRPGFHFDYFTVDLNGELSGMNGVLLEEQSQYVNLSVHHVLELYANRKGAPQSVILVGHSMGGIIAHSIAESSSDLIPLIITLASPYLRPPLTMDYNMYGFYKKVQNSLNKTMVVSLSGGFNDFLVPPYLTFGGDVNVVTTTVPKVWIPSDHLCILWCKQLVLAINRALFESIDVKTKQITSDFVLMKTIFHHYLTSNSGVKIRQLQRYGDVVHIDNAGEWIEKLPRQYTVSLPQGTKHPQWHMVRFVNQPKHEFLTVVAVNLEVTDWVFACSASHVRGQSRICVDAIPLSHQTEIAPTVRYKRRLLRINMHGLKQNKTTWTHIVVKIPPTDKSVILHVDVHNEHDRKISVRLPKLWSVSKHNVIRETADKAVEYELMLPQLHHLIQSFQLHVEPFNCLQQSHHAVATLNVPWGNETSHKFFTELDDKPFQMRLYSSRPQHFADMAASVKLTLDPTCKYRISIQTSWIGTLGQMARYYSPLLFANVVAVILMTFRGQLESISTTEMCPLFFVAVKEGAKPYYVLTSVKLISKLMGIKNLSKFLPLPDWTILSNEGSDFFLLPLLLYTCSVGIVWILAVALSVAMVVCETTAHKVMMKFLAMTVTGTMTWSEWLMNGLQKLPGMVAGILVLISVSTCGGLALAIGTLFYFFKLTKMSQDFIESLVWKVAKNAARKLKAMIFKKEKLDLIEAEVIPSITDKSCDETVNNENPPEINDEEKDNIANEKENDAANKDLLNIEELEDSKSCSSSLENLCNEVRENSDTGVDANISDVEVKLKSNDPVILSSDWLQTLLVNDEIFFHFTLFMLWAAVALLNVPSVLTWAHNYKFNKVLQPDPSFFSGLALSICALPLWQLKFPRTRRCCYRELGQIIFVAAIVVLVYCPLSLYRLNYLLSCIIIVVVLHQLFAPNRRQPEVHAGNDENKDVFDKLKTKLD